MGIIETDGTPIPLNKFYHVCSGLHHSVFQENLDPEIAQPNMEKGNSDPHSQVDHLLNSQGSEVHPTMAGISIERFAANIFFFKVKSCKGYRDCNPMTRVNLHLSH